MFGDGSCFQFPQTENMSILSEFLPLHCFVHAEKYSEENQILSQDGRIFTAFYQGNREKLESYAANSNVAAALLDAWNGQWVQ